MPKKTARRPMQIVSRLGALSTVSAGLIGAATVATVGPPLAMGLAIWTGRTTEPVMPDASYPWLIHAICLASAGSGYWLGRERPGPIAELLLHGGSVASALVPIFAVVSLWGAT